MKNYKTPLELFFTYIFLLKCWILEPHKTSNFWSNMNLTKLNFLTSLELLILEATTSE